MWHIRRNRHTHWNYALVVYKYTFSKTSVCTQTKSNWKWLSKYADSNIPKRISNCCLSVTTCSPITMCWANVIISINIHMITILYGTMLRPEVPGNQVAFVFPWDISHSPFDVKVPCSNLTTDKVIYYQKSSYIRVVFVFLSVLVTYKNTSVHRNTILALKGLFLRTWYL